MANQLRISGPRGAPEYPHNLDDSWWIIWQGNGHKWPVAIRALDYLSHSHINVLNGSALWTTDSHYAARFETEADAVAWLADQERRRASSYGATVSTVADMKAACGYAEAPPAAVDPLELFPTVKALGDSGYLFRITDNGGASFDRLTVIFCDGDYLGLSLSPSHPQGFSQWGERIDLQGVAERVEAGQEVDLQLGDLPPELREHIRRRVNEGWRDYLEKIEARDPVAVAPSRELAEPNEGGPDHPGVGIYAAGKGFCVRMETDNAAEDFGPFLTAAEALAGTLPQDYSLTGPEYHSTCDPGSLNPVPDAQERIRKLESTLEEE